MPEIATVATDSFEDVALNEVSPPSGLDEVIVTVTASVEFVKTLSIALMSTTLGDKFVFPCQDK